MRFLPKQPADRSLRNTALKVNAHTLILTRRSMQFQSKESGPVMFSIRDNTLRVFRSERAFWIGTET
jgi:hypothetical protein